MSETRPPSGELSQPRPIDQIFNDLRSLAQTDGSLHCISSIIQRDWFLTVDMQENTIIGEPSERWRLDKLNNNELSLLLGLAVQSPTNRVFTILPSASKEFVAKADELLREFHDAVMAPLRDLAMEADIGAIAREAIYYSADSFYSSQYETFARYRYKNDNEWLLKHAGLSIRPMLNIARFIATRVNQQMTYVLNRYGGAADKDGRPQLSSELDFSILTGMLTIPKEVLRKEFGNKADAFLAKFSIPAFGANLDFDNPFGVNQVNAAPLIDFGDFIFVPNQYRLFGSIYESPFYWTMADKLYRDTASENRGRFVEKSASAILRRIFGDQYVYDNVVIMDGKDIAAEADVLLCYGEFLIVVQAKSKRVTMKARSGDQEALKIDFKGAIQDPYHQAYKFGELVEAGKKCIGKNGEVIKLPDVKRVFPVVLLSDSFPGMTFLSRNMLEQHQGVAPVVWDLATLDTIAQILPTPVDLLYFLKCRSDAFDSIMSDSEYNYLGYHLTLKLAKSSEYDFLQIDRDFATPVDDYMVALEAGASPERPVSLLDRIQIPIFSELFKELKSAPPDLAGIIIDLYDFSSDALQSLGNQILDARKEVVAGKAFKSLSIPTKSGGLTYVIARDRDPRTTVAAHSIGQKYKYDTKSDRWYVIMNVIDTDRMADAVSPILGRWTESDELSEHSKIVGEAFQTKRTLGPGEVKT